MRMRDLHNELLSYYQGVYGVYDGKLYLIDDISPPEPDEQDEYGDGSWPDDDGTLEMDTDIHRFDAECREITLTDGTSGRDDTPSENIGMDKFDFSFPDVGLVNVPVVFQDIDEHFNVVKHMGRTASRQWRRAMRRDSINANMVGGAITTHLIEATGQSSRELATSRSNNAIYRMYFPKYFSVDEALSALQTTIGTYAINSEWWVGQGKHSIVFGYGNSVCGNVSEEGIFKLDNENLGFLKEPLIELVGAGCYE